MGVVVSLADRLKAQRDLRNADVPYDEIVERILNISHRHVSLGAVVLLHHVAYLINKGHPYLSYTYLCERLGVARATLSAYLEELETSEMVKIIRSRKSATLNQPNFFAIDFNGPLGDDMSKLKLPKNPNKKGSSKSELPTQGVVQKLDCYINTNNKEKRISKEIQGRSAPGFETAEEAIAASSMRITRKRAEVTARAAKAGVQVTLAGVKATWTTAMLKEYPTVPPVLFTAAEFAIFKQRIRPILSTCNLSEFFDFIVGSWPTLRETKFRWLRARGNDIALSPSLPELMRYWKVFAQAFSDSRMVEANNERAKVRTTEEKAKDDLVTERAKRANVEAENARLKAALERTERIAFARQERKPVAPRQSLADLRRTADGSYNDEVDLPQWSSHDKG